MCRLENSNTYASVELHTALDSATSQQLDTLYNCGSGERLSILAKCNAVVECIDGSDEEECPVYKGMVHHEHKSTIYP